MDEFWNLLFGWDYIVFGFLALPFILVFAALSVLWDKVRGK